MEVLGLVQRRGLREKPRGTDPSAGASEVDLWHLRTLISRLGRTAQVPSWGSPQGPPNLGFNAECAASHPLRRENQRVGSGESAGGGVSRDVGKAAHPRGGHTHGWGREKVQPLWKVWQLLRRSNMSLQPQA